MKNYTNFCFNYERIKLEVFRPPVSPDLTAWAAIQQNI